MGEVEVNADKIREIQDLIISFAQFDFNNKYSLTDTNCDIDALGIGVNMLGEELKSSILSLKEKELLLKEIHHRVKNNLQIVSSFLSLQINKFEDEKSKNVVYECQGLIKTIAIIHEMLFQSRDFRNANLKEYVDKLVYMKKTAMTKVESGIKFEMEVDDDIFLDNERLLPLGLIINEAISNSIKYAFPEGKGTIIINTKHLDGKCKVLIADNGIGLSPGFQLDKDANTGMNIIYMLADQIDMELNLKHGSGITYELTFDI